MTTQLKSSTYKNCSVILPEPCGKTNFDENGICNVPESEVITLLAGIPHLSLVKEGDEAHDWNENPNVDGSKAFNEMNAQQDEDEKEKSDQELQEEDMLVAKGIADEITEQSNEKLNGGLEPIGEKVDAPNVLSEEEELKQENINKIMSIKTKPQLRDLCIEYPETEWKNLSPKELKEYLISKL